MEDIQKKWVCGFWRRISALLIDSIVLGVFGAILGLFFEKTFVQLDGWGRLIGFTVSIIYFGIMNSSISNGQTVGKNILGIQVVDSSNSTISVPKSFFRYSFLAVPFSLNGSNISVGPLDSFLVYPLSFIIFGGLFAIPYLYIFNRVTRQSVHDIALGTFVVNTNTTSVKLPAIWKPHFVVVTFLFIGAMLLPAFTSGLAKSDPFKGLLVTQGALSKNASVKSVEISEGATTINTIGSESTTTTYISVIATLFENKVDDSVLAKQLAQTVVNTLPESLNKKLISVELLYGYDIGITSKWDSHNHTFDPKKIEVSN